MRSFVYTIKKFAALLLLAGSFSFPFVSIVVAKDLNVVVSIKPLHSLVAGVMKGVGEPHLLIKNASPHDYALKPSDARALQNADVVVWIGLSLERSLSVPLQNLTGKVRTLTLGSVNHLKRHPVREYQKTGSQNSTRQETHGHKHGWVDPHTWLDPLNAQTFVREIALVLMETDKPHAALYRANARHLLKRLEALALQIEKQLAPVRKKPYLTLHDNFQYFEKAFNLNYGGSIALHSGRRPGARHVMQLLKTIRGENISCVFGETLYSPMMVHMIMRDTKVRISMLDPLGIHIKKGPELYFTLMQNNARSFFFCLRP